MTAPAVASKTLEFSKTIHAPLDIIWSMLSNRDDLCDWLSDDAHLYFREGGFATFIWREPPAYDYGPHAYGVYQTIVEHEKIVMTWHDGTDQVTKVKFKLEDTGGNVQLKVWHKGFTDDARAEHYEAFWNNHLHTLKVQLETGARPDISERVIVGVMVDNSDENRPEKGTLIDRAVPGYSAEKAGIISGDIILEVNGIAMDSQTTFRSAIGDRKPGDSVSVKYLRDGEIHIVDVKLQGHPIPPIPASFDEMAQQHRDEYDRVNAELEKAVAGVTQSTAENKDADDNSIRLVLARMINRQRHTFEWLATYAHGPRRINPYYTEPERLQALIATHPTIEELVAQLKRTQNETIAMIDAFDKSLERRKGYLWWMAFEIWLSEDTAMGEIHQINELKAQAN